MLATVLTKTFLDRWKAVVIGAFVLTLLFLSGMAVYRDIDLDVYTGLPEAFRALMNIPADADVGTLAYGVIGSTNAVLYLYTPEIYPTRMRAIGTGLATSWLRLASAAAPTIVGLMVGEQGVAAVFLMFAGVAVVGMIAATRMIETSNRRLEDIAQ